ncbi:MAG: twin-arginine translocation pathway signal protein [Parvularculaceae bacterium]|nr:twin-arginine translocation pathway signal protein [Parvularculaceae bacterium]
MASRRGVLKIGSAALLLTAAGSAAAWALTRAPKAAQAPWDAAAKGFGDARLDALAYAILAPNPHNMQPWRVRLTGEDAFTLHADPARLLPETDPFSRQIVIGFGAFLELFRQAAAEKGARAEIALFPEGEPKPYLDARPIAHVRLVADSSAPRDPLFGHALARRTNRNPFEKRAVDATILERIKSAAVPGVFADAVADAARLAEVKKLADDAWRIEWGLDRTRRETIKVTRVGRREIEENPYGIALAGPLLEALGGLGVLTRENMDDPDSTAYEQTLANYSAAIVATPAFLFSITSTNTRADQIEAGRSWVRMQLAAAGEGLAFHPLSQALQEFPEMEEPYRRAHALLASGGGIVQMLARVGYAGDAPPAPREPLAARLLKG